MNEEAEPSMMMDALPTLLGSPVLKEGLPTTIGSVDPIIAMLVSLVGVSIPQWIVEEGDLDVAKDGKLTLVDASPINVVMPWCVSVEEALASLHC